jgi:hypothetical protein
MGPRGRAGTQTSWLSRGARKASCSPEQTSYSIENNRVSH